jgi:Putative zinc-finger
MVVSCEEVWREISNYLENDLDPTLRATIEEHFRDCKHCTAVLDGTRNVIRLYGDERMFEAPLGFSHRLHRRLQESLPQNNRRRTFMGWMVAAAAGVLVAGGLEAARLSGSKAPQLRSAHALPSSHVPPDMMVLVAQDGKTFHRAGCTFIHDKQHLRQITAREAEREGYAPCVRCMKQYLT